MMKMRFKTIILVLTLLTRICVSSETTASHSVNITKIQDQYTTFISHIFWPDEETIKKYHVSTEQIPDDIQEFKRVIRIVIKPEFLPDEKFIYDNCIALENFKNNSDYLLMQYIKKDISFQLEEGKALYVLLNPLNKSTKEEVHNMGKYVKDLVFRIFNIPKVDKKGKEPSVFISEKNIGNSTVGTLTYNASFPPPEHWYSHIRWWSNGKYLLIEIPKLFNGQDLSEWASPPHKYKNPRKFRNLQD